MPCPHNEISIVQRSHRQSAVAAGIKGIWNFVPIDLVAAVPIENVHLNDSLSELSYKIEHGVLGD